MNDNARAFLEAAQADPELRERLCRMAVGELVAAARERGVELSEEDFRPVAGELGEGDLENVAGGGDRGCLCVIGGGGGGTDSYDHKIYGCACVVYGQGGDGRASDANCFCSMGGSGWDSAQECILTAEDAR